MLIEETVRYHCLLYKAEWGAKQNRQTQMPKRHGNSAEKEELEKVISSLTSWVISSKSFQETLNLKRDTILGSEICKNCIEFSGKRNLQLFVRQ